MQHEKRKMYFEPYKNDLYCFPFVKRLSLVLFGSVNAYFFWAKRKKGKEALTAKAKDYKKVLQLADIFIRL